MPSVTVAARHFRTHGYCFLESVVPESITQALLDDCDKQARSGLDAESVGNRGLLRECLNRDDNIEKDSWWTALQFLCDPSEQPSLLMTKLFGDAWWFDRCGGDVVYPGAGFSEPCVPHTDWRGVTNGMISLSVFTDDITPEMAPMVLYSRSSGLRYVGTGPRGSILMRCVDVIHHGSANMFSTVRVLPAFRFVTSAGLRNGYDRRPYVPEHIYNKFQVNLADRCVFIRKPSHHCADFV